MKTCFFFVCSFVCVAGRGQTSKSLRSTHNQQSLTLNIDAFDPLNKNRSSRVSNQLLSIPFYMLCGYVCMYVFVCLLQHLLFSDVYSANFNHKSLIFVIHRNRIRKTSNHCCCNKVFDNITTIFKLTEINCGQNMIYCMLTIEFSSNCHVKRI